MKRHKLVLVDLINENGFKSFVEIGVAMSDTLTHILQNTKLSEYWAIDPWLPYEESMKIPMEWWDSWYIKACRRMVYFPQLRVFRMASEVAVGMFPNDYFDFVYIDGNHQYGPVLLDIKFWLPKVKKGGILGGHDYGRKRTGVKKAVDECFKEEEIKLLEYSVWIKRI